MNTIYYTEVFRRRIGTWRAQYQTGEFRFGSTIPWCVRTFYCNHVNSIYASTISTFVLMSDFGMRAGKYAMISSTFGRPPAKPVTAGGPVRISGASSLVNRSTEALSCPRTPMRSWTSGMSGEGSPGRWPCVALTPTNSVSITSNFKPRRSRRSRRILSAACALA